MMMIRIHGWPHWQTGGVQQPYYAQATFFASTPYMTGTSHPTGSSQAYGRSQFDGFQRHQGLQVGGFPPPTWAMAAGPQQGSDWGDMPDVFGSGAVGMTEPGGFRPPRWVSGNGVTQQLGDVSEWQFPTQGLDRHNQIGIGHPPPPWGASAQESWGVHHRQPSGMSPDSLRQQLQEQVGPLLTADGTANGKVDRSKLEALLVQAAQGGAASGSANSPTQQVLTDDMWNTLVSRLDKDNNGLDVSELPPPPPPHQLHPMGETPTPWGASPFNGGAPSNQEAAGNRSNGIYPHRHAPFLPPMPPGMAGESWQSATGNYSSSQVAYSPQNLPWWRRRYWEDTQTIEGSAI